MKRSITEEIQDYKNGRLDQNGKKWDLYVINPYSLAYHRAYDLFKETLDRQAALDKLKMDLMLTGLSFFGGTVFTAVFGETTTKALTGRVAVNQLNKSNNIRTLKIAGFLDNNPTAQFVIGELWSKSSDVISNKTKAIFEPNPKNFPEVNAIAQKPYEIKHALTQFKLNCEVKLFEVLDELMKSDLSDRDKAILFTRAKTSQFCNPPDSNEYPANLADKIELSFYMKYILDTDYLIDFGNNWNKRKSIQAIPGSAAYPKHIPMRQQVCYGEVGQIIIDRINKLYKKHYKGHGPFIDSDYFGEQTDARILKRADIILRDLSKSIAPRVKQLRAVSEARVTIANRATRLH